MADPRITPALREFGFGAKRLLKPLTLGTTPPLMLRMSGDDQPVAAPARQGHYLPPDARDYRPARSAQPVAPSDDYYAPYYQLPRGDDPNAISFSGNDYSREMDARVAQARAAQAAREFGQQKMQMEQQEMDRARQAWAAEDEANAAIAEGVPVDQVIRQFPQLAQSKSFGNYARQVARPAQNTLAPHFRQMLKSQEARADFDEHFSRFADVQKADDYAREQEANRLLRIDAIESGVPLEAFEKMKGPLTRENVALLKRQYADKANIDPAERDYREAIKLLADADKAERAASGATFDPEAFQKRQTALRNLYFPPAPVAAPAAPAAGAPAPAAKENRLKEVMSGEKHPLDMTPGEREKLVEKALTEGTPDEAIMVASHEGVSDSLRGKAIQRLEGMLKEGARPEDTLDSYFARRERIQKGIEKGKTEASLAPLRQEYAEARASDQNRVGNAITDMSADLGLDENLVLNTLADQRGSYQMPLAGVPEKYHYLADKNTGKVFLKDLLGAYISDSIPAKEGSYRKAPNWQEMSKTRAPSYDLIEKGALAKEADKYPATMGGIVDEYLSRARRNLAGAGVAPAPAPASATPGSEKIIIGKPVRKPTPSP